MTDAFERALARVLVYEGGNDDDPQDPGGRTSRGILQREYDVWRKAKGLPGRDVWAAADDEIRAIYFANYWQRAHCEALPAGIDFVVFDAAVNSGVAQTAKWLQRSLGITVDGDFGPATRAAVLADSDYDALIANVLARRLAMLHGLKTWRRFGGGWSARIANVRKIGQAWASGSVGPDPVLVADLGGNRKAKPTSAAPVPIDIGPLAATIGAGGAAAAQAAQALDPLKELLPVAMWSFVGLTIAGVIAGLVVKVLQAHRAARLDGSAIGAIDDDADAGCVPVRVDKTGTAPVPPAEAARTLAAPVLSAAPAIQGALA